MKHLPKLLGALLLTLALLASIGLASTNAHAAPVPAQQASPIPLAPDQASVTLFEGQDVVLLHWGDSGRFPVVSNICTGSNTVVFFDSDQTGPHLIKPDMCESFQNEFGFVRVRPAFL